VLISDKVALEHMEGTVFMVQKRGYSIPKTHRLTSHKGYRRTLYGNVLSDEEQANSGKLPGASYLGNSSEDRTGSVVS